MNLDAQIGANVRRLRERAGYSQRELAERAAAWGHHLTQSALARIEGAQRKLTFSEAWAFVVVAGGSFDDLCWIEDTEDS